MKKDIRSRILIILSEPATVTALKEKLKDVESFGTIAYHLKKLEKEGIVEKEKDTTKRGSPTTYSLVDKDLIKIIKKMREDSVISRVAILRRIKNNPSIEEGELSLFVDRSDLPSAAEDDIFGCTDDNLATLHFEITEKGEKFLKQNE